ncbi:MAG TPA: caspase family protein [Syntrophobacteraceae bacterium]|nr:caspase family protein [Syntrophobacteraceae bacterium]
MPEEPGDFALVIGINHYPLYGTKGRPLKGAIRDAQMMFEWLTDKTRGGGLPPEHCHLILSSLDTVNPPQPRKDKIDDALTQIWEQAEQARKRGVQPRRFYFYFSGHGQAIGPDDVALCMANWARNREAAALSFRKYLNLVQECLPFGEVVILLDCCRSRKINARAQESELTCPMPRDEAGRTQVFLAYATEFQSEAFEGGLPPLVEDDEPIVHGHFTEALLAALKGGAARPEGGVAASSLWSYLDKVVPRIAKRHQHMQKPRIVPFSVPPGDPGEPVFGTAPRRADVDVKFVFTPKRQGPIKLEGPTLEVICEEETTSADWVKTLPIGSYLLTDQGTGETLSVILQATEGEFRVEF